MTFSNIGYDEGIYLNDNEESSASVQVEGHSMAGKKGRDIICSAVSALSQTAVIGLTKLVNIEQSVTMRDGFLRTEFDTGKLTERDRDRLKVILEILCIGVLEIIKEYPGTIDIEFLKN